SPKELHTETATAKSKIYVQWKWQSQPNVEKVGQSELWHAGTLPQAIRGCEDGPNNEKWPRRSLVVIQSDPNDVPARQLAIQLLDRGSADRVLLGTDWAAHLNKLIQVDFSLTKGDQLLLILPSGAPVPEVDFQGSVGVVTASDFKALIPPRDFPGGGVRMLTQVWNDAQAIETPLLRGGPKEETDKETGITFVTVCGGTFTMGSDKEKDSYASDDETPPHPVTLSTFEISKTTITTAQYQPSRQAQQAPKDSTGDGTLPATSMGWDKAKAFCEKQKYALPSEAQWEYAVRGGSTTRWSFGDKEKLLGDYAWFSGNSGSRAHLVGTKKPNPLGLSDMHGNAYEWVEDCYDDKVYHDRSALITDPTVAPGISGQCQYRARRIPSSGPVGSLNVCVRSTG
ncbi:MAG: formylglycine-generating enzyme family protein, partial [Candidatus Binatia bacterium]